MYYCISINIKYIIHYTFIFYITITNVLDYFTYNYFIIYMIFLSRLQKKSRVKDRAYIVFHSMTF